MDSILAIYRIKYLRASLVGCVFMVHHIYTGFPNVTCTRADSAAKYVNSTVHDSNILPHVVSYLISVNP